MGAASREVLKKRLDSRLSGKVWAPEGLQGPMSFCHASLHAPHRSGSRGFCFLTPQVVQDPEETSCPSEDAQEQAGQLEHICSQWSQRLTRRPLEAKRLSCWQAAAWPPTGAAPWRAPLPSTSLTGLFLQGCFFYLDLKDHFTHHNPPFRRKAGWRGAP